MTDTPWKDVVAPIVSRCQVAETFGADVVWNSVGAAALRTVISEMARLLDEEIRTRSALALEIKGKRLFDDPHP